LEVAEVVEPTFEQDIKSLFREKDRNAMIGRFDLWSYEDVRDNAPAILAALRAGIMPCDGSWPTEDIDLFERWIADGTTG
jgi:hypothetical protein